MSDKKLEILNCKFEKLLEKFIEVNHIGPTGETGETGETGTTGAIGETGAAESLELYKENYIGPNGLPNAGNSTNSVVIGYANSINFTTFNENANMILGGDANQIQSNNANTIKCIISGGDNNQVLGKYNTIIGSTTAKIYGKSNPTYNSIICNVGSQISDKIGKRVIGNCIIGGLLDQMFLTNNSKYNLICSGYKCYIDSGYYNTILNGKNNLIASGNFNTIAGRNNFVKSRNKDVNYNLIVAVNGYVNGGFFNMVGGNQNHLLECNYCQIFMHQNTVNYASYSVVFGYDNQDTGNLSNLNKNNTTFGMHNTIANGSYDTAIVGNNNFIGYSSHSVAIFGENNRIRGETYSSVIFGKDANPFNAAFKKTVLIEQLQSSTLSQYPNLYIFSGNGQLLTGVQPHPPPPPPDPGDDARELKPKIYDETTNETTKNKNKNKNKNGDGDDDNFDYKIGSIADKIEMIMKLHPISFHYKTDPNNLLYGFIAEELYELNPEFVLHNDETGDGDNENENGDDDENKEVEVEVREILMDNICTLAIIYIQKLNDNINNLKNMIENKIELCEKQLQ